MKQVRTSLKGLCIAAIEAALGVKFTAEGDSGSPAAAGGCTLLKGEAPSCRALRITAQERRGL